MDELDAAIRPYLRLLLLLAALLLLLAGEGVAQDGCTRSVQNGKTCVTCCNNGYCQTWCL